MVSTMCFAGLEPLVCVNVRPASAATFRNWVESLTVGLSDCQPLNSVAAANINSVPARVVSFNGRDSLRAFDPACHDRRFPVRPDFPAVARSRHTLWPGTDAPPGRL